MCGIAGSFSPRGIDLGLLPAMADAIRHRGPDGEGYLAYGPISGLRIGRSPVVPGDGADVVGLAHLRLSIIDLSEANDQPAVDPSRELALNYNGEIYNYLELRRELEAKGHEFRTSGDTEVLLAAYSEWGPACVQRLVGMWAFAILDLKRRALFLSRDRFGIKPLYWAIDEAGRFHFASEIKALLAVPSLRPEPDEDVVRRYLITGAVDESERTFFDSIRSVPPAHNLALPLDVERPTPAPEPYWSIPAEGYRGGRRKAAREFAERFTESVAMHARSDVPVGTCLSGGLDSSSIVCVAEGLRRRGEIPAYAHSGFGYLPVDPAFSERDYMEEVVRRTSLLMTYVEASPERFASVLPEIARQQDEPFGSTSIAAQWFVFEAARRGGMKVMLDGQGADEVLSGYHGYFPLIGLALLRSRRALRYARFARAHRRERGDPPVSARVAIEEFRSGQTDRAVETMTPEAAKALPAAQVMSADLRGRLRPEHYQSPEFDSVHELLAAHTSSLGLPSLLRFEDRNSMAHSIEARVPFLDHRLVEFAFRLPFHYKVNGVETKHVLREALKGVLPEPIRTRRDKIGFRAEPSVVWKLADRNRERLLDEPVSYESAWFDRKRLRALMDGADRSVESEWLLWRVINTKLWLRAFWGSGGDPLA